MNKAAKAWSIWEGRTSKLRQDPWEVVKGKFGSDKFSLAFARIENHYFTNKVVINLIALGHKRSYFAPYTYTSLCYACFDTFLSMIRCSSRVTDFCWRRRIWTRSDTSLPSSCRVRMPFVCRRVESLLRQLNWIMTGLHVVM